MALLALDTSTELCTVALLKDGRLTGELRQKVKTGHAGMLLQLIDNLLTLCDCPKTSIDHIAVGRGPGSFTGIRIGIATAKGLAMALNCMLSGVCSLDAMAYGARPSRIPIMPIMDARKGEVFCARYAPDGERLTPYLNLSPEQVRAAVEQETLLIGTGLELYGATLAATLGSNYLPGPQVLWHPSAAMIGTLASEHPEKYTDVTPLYVRASDAALSLKR